MNLLVIFLILIFIVGFAVFLYYILSNNKKVFRELFYKKKFKGVILFDIDGTLTEGKNNYKTVQKALNKGFAVGICTAGAGYTPKNILDFDWCPKNLYEFMKKHNF